MALEKITSVSGRGVYVPGNDIDTDRIIPARFMKCVVFDGLGEFLFYDVRHTPEGKPTGHPIDKPEHKGAKILLSGANFGCGSSREHAPWAIDQYGFRAVIAPSYADIFFNNCFKNGLLPIVLPENEVSKLFDEVVAFPGYQLTIDLERQVVVRAQGEEVPFEVQAFRKYCLINGLDDIGLTLRHAEKIKTFEAERLATKPWLAHVA